MNLIQRLKTLGKIEGLKESDLNLIEAENFLKEHEKHGGYEIETYYDVNGDLTHIHLICLGLKLINTTECRHTDPKGLDEESYTPIYERTNPTGKVYRNNRHESIGHF